MLSGATTELISSSKRSSTSTSPILDSTNTDISLSSPSQTTSVGSTPLTYVSLPIEKLGAFTTDQKQEKEEPVSLPFSSTLEKILISSQLHNDDPGKLAEGIVTAFNQGYSEEDMDKVFTLSTIRGERVQQGEFLLAVRNSRPYLATFNRQLVALVINLNPTISLTRKGKFKLSEKKYFGETGRHVLTVPVGQYAVATHNNKPVIFDEGVHVIHDPNFKFNEDTGYINQNQDYIHHQNIHILRVKFGEIAKVTVNSTPLLLEPNEEPYVFVTPNFKYHGCEPASKNLITHSSVKRVMPKNGEVAITNNGGTLVTIKPSAKPKIITSPTHEVVGFLGTNRQTLILPTEKTKEERVKERRSELETNNEIFRTSDSLEIAIKILVIYEISDPDKVLQHFSFDMIIRHIEHIAVVDMGKAIQKHTSGDFLASSGSIKEGADTNPDAKNVTQPSAPILQSLQDEVMASLSQDLKQVGITLIRVNVELPKIVDDKIAEQMGEQSLTTAKTNARQAIQTQETIIARTGAEREAEVSAIKLKQENALALQTAQNKKAVATAEAEALKISTRAQIDSQKEFGKLYVQYPVLAEIRKAEIIADALANAALTITPGQFQTFFGTAANNPFGMFKPAPVTTSRGEVFEHEADGQTLDGSKQESATHQTCTP